MSASARFVWTIDYVGVVMLVSTGKGAWLVTATGVGSSFILIHDKDMKSNI